MAKKRLSLLLARPKSGTGSEGPDSAPVGQGSDETEPQNQTLHLKTLTGFCLTLAGLRSLLQKHVWPKVTE